MIKPIQPCLSLDGKAREAAEYYCSIFPNSKIVNDTKLVVHFELNGQPFIALNAAENNEFSEALSFHITCRDQKEVDYYWDRLTEDGGSEGNCGWCKDKYGISWQVIPDNLAELIYDPDKGGRVVGVFLQMKKLDIEKLNNA